MNDTIETRVARGVALLDERLPGWVERIDLYKLDLASGCRCILGQEFRGHVSESSYSNGYLIGLDELFNDDDDEAARHGFTVEVGEPFAALEVEWRRVILARRGGEGR